MTNLVSINLDSLNLIQLMLAGILMFTAGLPVGLAVLAAIDGIRKALR